MSIDSIISRGSQTDNSVSKSVKSIKNHQNNFIEIIKKYISIGTDDLDPI